MKDIKTWVDSRLKICSQNLITLQELNADDDPEVKTKIRIQKAIQDMLFALKDYIES